MSKISLAFLSNFTGKNLTEEEFEKVDVEKVLTDTLNDKIKAAKKEGWDDASSRAKSEILNDAEKRISKALEVEKGTIEEMIAQYKSKKTDQKIDDEMIKNSDVFKDAIKKLNDKLSDQEKNFNSKLDQYRNKEIDTSLSDKVKSIAKDQKWNINKEDQLELLTSFIKLNYMINVDDNGNLVLKTKDGKEVRDEFQNVLDFDKIVTTTGSKYFDVVNNDGRESPNNKGVPPAKKTEGVEPFKSVEEYVTRVSSESDPTKLAAMKAQYESQIQDGKFISN